MITIYCIVAAVFFAASIATAKKPNWALIALASAAWPITVAAVVLVVLGVE